MNCELIFYSARKTSFCERSLLKSFSEMGLSLSGSSFSTDSDGLGTKISQAFKKCNIVFVIGGLGMDGIRGIKSIISRALARANVDECKKLRNGLGDDGYVFRAQQQILILLPDEPGQIEEIMRGSIGRYMLQYSEAND